MKIAWFTPFSSTSAIGRVGKEVCDVLALDNEVDIWTQHKGNLIETKLKVINFDSNTEPEKLDKYDCVFYNFGNFAGNHREIYDMFLKKKGYVILHDQTMAGFWGQYYLFPEFGGNAQTGLKPYKEMFKKYYGADAEKLCIEAQQADVYPIYSYKHMEEYKLLEPFMENALGVFTHAEFFAEKLKDIFNGEIGFSYLPCKKPEITECKDEKIIEIIDKAKKLGKKILVSNGIVHPVKQIDKVVDVLCDNDSIADKVCYIVIGSYGGEYGEKLKKISKGKLKDCLYTMGYQPYSVMEYALENADLCINMRYPNSEVCSLSLLEQMSHKRPVIVLNSGIYGEIPEKCVIKIEYESAYEQLKNILEDLDKNLKEYKQKGINAENFIKEKCTAEEYAKRIMDFAKKAEYSSKIAAFENRFIDELSYTLQKCGINEDTLLTTTDNIVNAVTEMFSDTACSLQAKNKTLGVWAGFLYHIPGLHREGISRFMSFLCENLVKIYGVSVEIWSYSFNAEEMEICFSSILKDKKYRDKIKIVNEKNWISIFNPLPKDVDAIGTINADKDNLALVAARYSKADTFMPLIVYLDAVLSTEKRIVVPAHDMAIEEQYSDFLEKDCLYKARRLDILYRAENLARNGAEFSSNCKTIMEKQVLKYVKNLKPEKAHFVYLPVNIPEGIEKNIMEEKEIRETFSIEGRYMFYPTQVRPYKNISLLIKAFNEIKNKYSDLKLVLTGNPKDMPEVERLINKYDLWDRIVLLKNLSETELYSVYKYAAVVPVTSKFEGGFSWQACEALFMEVPLVLSCIDVVEERIKSCGFTKENCGIYLFDVNDYIKLAEGISLAIENKKDYLERQQKFAKSLLSWSWKDAAKEYYNILFEKTEK